MIKLWGWDKKPRTMLRYIKIGDTFCFKYDDHTYCFGQIISKVQFYIAGIWGYVSEQPAISKDIVLNAEYLLITPLDVYSLFDRKREGELKREWRIIGHQDDYALKCVEDIWFAWGIGFDCRKSDIFGNTVSISEDEWRTLQKLSPKGEYEVKQMLSDKLKAE